MPTKKDYVSIVAEAARRETEKLCRHYFPDGRREGDWWSGITSPFRNDKTPGSFKINLRDGRGCDFADENHKRFDWLDIAQALDPFVSTPLEAAKVIEGIIGAVPDALPPSPTAKNAPKWKIVTPIPDDAKLPDGLPHRNEDGSWGEKLKWSKLWTYRDAQGRPLCHIARFDKPDGTKDIRPLVWTDEGRYRWKSLPKPRPLYGLDLLARRTDAPVLVVEGEKCADIANELLSDFVAISWSGGTNAVKHTDWAVLKQRDVIIWPDNDEPGIDAARQINVLTGGNARIIDPPHDKPSGWDIADAKEDGTDLAEIIASARSGKSVKSLSVKISDADRMLVFDKDHVNKQGRLLPTIKNLQSLLTYYEVKLRYNALAREIDFMLPNKALYDATRANDARAEIKSVANLNQLPYEESFVDNISRADCYNPAADWILSRPWDGTSRILDLYDTITVQDDYDSMLRDTLIHRWMLSAVAAAFNEVGNHPKKFWSKGVLVLQGDQDLGKTSWLRKLTGQYHDSLFGDGLSLDFNQKDSVSQAVTKWIVELGEIDSTVRARDISALKAFITREYDEIRKPYAKEPDRYNRQTVFAGTVNPKEFLADKTGNVRFWTIRCKSINYRHSIDMQQVWAEIYDEYKKAMHDDFVPWQLDTREAEMLAAANEEHETPDAVFEKIAVHYDWEHDRNFWTEKSTSEVLDEIGYERPAPIDIRSAGAAIRKLGKQSSSKKVTGGKRVYLVPPTNYMGKSSNEPF